MEGLRGLAVTLVFLVHYTTLARPWVAAGSSTDYVVEMLHSVGNTGVDLFFVLSGYLIYGTLIEKRKAFGPYFARRIERIYPVFAVVTAVYLLLFFVFPSESKLPAGAGSAVLFIFQNLIFLPGLFPVQAINTVTWSLSYEMFYYLIMPLLIALAGMRAWGRDARIGFFLGLGVVLALVFGVLGGPVRMMMFIAGIVLYELVTKGVRIQRERGLGLVALALGVACVWILHGKGLVGQVVLLCVLFGYGCFTCFCIADGGHGVTRDVFSWRPLRWLGNMSYSYYLIHGLTLKFIFLISGKLWPPVPVQTWKIWVGVPFAFILTLISSAILFIVVEKPFSLTPGSLINRFKKSAVAPAN